MSRLPQRELLGQFFYASIKFLGRKIANANGLYEGRLEIFRDKVLDNCKSPQAGSDTICTGQAAQDTFIWEFSYSNGLIPLLAVWGRLKL